MALANCDYQRFVIGGGDIAVEFAGIFRGLAELGDPSHSRGGIGYPAGKNHAMPA